MAEQPSRKRYYGYAEKLEGGLTARLEVVLEGYKIVRCHYDEIFADTPEEIAQEDQKPYYRQSKRYCLEYESAYPDGFNVLFDLLEQKVVLSQDLLDIKGLPWVKDSSRRTRNPEWDTYLRLAGVIRAEMQADSVRV